MVIRIFVSFLFILSIGAYFLPLETNPNDKKDKDSPELIFVDSTMYTLDTKSMNRIIFAKKAIRYMDRDVMYDGSLTSKNIDKKNNIITDNLLSDLIIKRGESFKFLNDVKFSRNNYLFLNTDELLYNAKTKIATNTLPFDGTYYKNSLKGKHIYLDMNNYYMKASDTHFEIEIEKKGN